jgi:threonine dehydratase
MSPTRHVELPTPDDLDAARKLVAEHLPPTPVVRVRLPGPGGPGDGIDAVLKLETMQPTGSFKVRGALVAVAAAGTDRPVVTASAGNHGLGVAFAAGRLGVPATVVVPTTASPAKVDALRRMDVELVQHGDDYEGAERHALALAERGATFVSPYNDRHVMAGQATVAAEVAEQVGEDVTLVVPVGGGGLIGGIALGVAARDGGPDTGAGAAGAAGRTRIVGVEAAASPAVSAAVAAGTTVTVPIGETLADGLGGNLEPGAVTPDAARGRVHSWVQVGEPAIAAAIRALVTRCGLVAEAAAAVAPAALMGGLVPVAGTPVVVLTGRNLAAGLLARLLAGDEGPEVALSIDPAAG